MTDRIDTTWTTADDGRVENAIRRGASRRDLLRMLAVGGVAVSGAGLIVGRATDAVAQTPKSGGHLKIATCRPRPPTRSTPAKASLSTDYVRCCAVYNRLTFLNEAGVPEMELAESIESADAKVWTVKLRKGVTFHSGKAFGAEDVIFSLKRHLDPAVGSKVNSIAKQITGVDKIDDLTVQGHPRQPPTATCRPSSRCITS